MKNILFRKRGELTTQQIVVLVILLVSFVVILIFIFFLQPKGLTDSQICQNSIVLQRKAAGLTGGVDCKTGYVCISGGVDCSDGDKNLDVNEDRKEEVLKAIADSMAECWWMFGEGKIDYTGTSYSLKCAVCSIISFDKEVQTKYPQISYQEFYDYLEKTKKTDSETYLHYLYGVFKVSDIDFSSGFKEVDLSGSIDTTGKYSMITGYNAEWSSKDDILKVVLIPTKDTSKLACAEFLTRA